MEQVSRPTKWPDLIVGLGLVAVAATLALFALPARSAMVVGLPAWLFPFLGLTIAGAGGIVLAALALRPAGRSTLDGRKTSALAKAVALPVAVVVSTGALMPIVGTLVVAPAMIALLMLWMGERSILRFIGTAVLFPLVVAAFATFVLGTPLP